MHTYIHIHTLIFIYIYIFMYIHLSTYITPYAVCHTLVGITAIVWSETEAIWCKTDNDISGVLVGY